MKTVNKIHIKFTVAISLSYIVIILVGLVKNGISLFLFGLFIIKEWRCLGNFFSSIKKSLVRPFADDSVTYPNNYL